MVRLEMSSLVQQIDLVSPYVDALVWSSAKANGVALNCCGCTMRLDCCFKDVASRV
ncbi:hypothetical protein KR52_10625 [Synechococcus sp. KORDI-52]|nr:hypothetical protein KR52_10625 [Synechococcus sp. KORDI-52]